MVSLCKQQQQPPSRALLALVLLLAAAAASAQQVATDLNCALSVVETGATDAASAAAYCEGLGDGIGGALIQWATGGWGCTLAGAVGAGVGAGTALANTSDCQSAIDSLTSSSNSAGSGTPSSPSPSPSPSTTTCATGVPEPSYEVRRGLACGFKQ